MKFSFALLASAVMTVAISVSASPAPQAPNPQKCPPDVKQLAVGNPNGGAAFDDRANRPAQITKVNRIIIVHANPGDENLSEGIAQVQVNLSGLDRDFNNMNGVNRDDDPAAQRNTLDLTGGDMVNKLSVIVQKDIVVGMKLTTVAGFTLNAGLIGEPTKVYEADAGFGLIGFHGRHGVLMDAIGPIWGKVNCTI